VELLHVDRLEAEIAQALLRRRDHVLGRERLIRVHARARRPLPDLRRDLRRDHELARMLTHDLPDQLLAVPVAVAKSRVDEGHAQLDRPAERAQRLVVFRADPPRPTDPPGAEAELGDAEARLAEDPRAHVVTVPREGRNGRRACVVARDMGRPVGILYEHPQWFVPLFAELDRRGIAYEPIHAGGLLFDPADDKHRYSLVVNRMSPSAWTRGHARALFSTLHYLGYLEQVRTPVLNGHDAYLMELSKARQIGLFANLGIAHPRTRVIDDPKRAAEAAAGLEFPVLVKPNVGGSGAGIVSFASYDELARAKVDLGVDGTALVQEQLPAEGDAIVRIEILDGRFLYAIRLRLLPGSFNLCPADYCELPGVADGVSGRGLPIEPFDPPAAVVEDAKRIVAAAGMDLGGVEYLVNARTGEPTFYDVNALSNFVANAPEVIGFDPFVQLVDLIVDRADATSERRRDTVGVPAGLA
jgi:hypothetical protein